jgi:hypothetical protein
MRIVDFINPGLISNSSILALNTLFVRERAGEFIISEFAGIHTEIPLDQTVYNLVKILVKIMFAGGCLCMLNFSMRISLCNF